MGPYPRHGVFNSICASADRQRRLAELVYDFSSRGGCGTRLQRRASPSLLFATLFVEKSCIDRLRAPCFMRSTLLAISAPAASFATDSIVSVESVDDQPFERRSWTHREFGDWPGSTDGNCAPHAQSAHSRHGGDTAGASNLTSLGLRPDGPRIHDRGAFMATAPS